MTPTTLTSEKEGLLHTLELYELANQSNKKGDVVKTFERYLEGVFNAILYKTTSAQNERINGNIQSLLGKARGFLNLNRFRINVMFYYGKFEFSH